MTLDVRLQLADVQCVLASCDVGAEPILVVTCDVHAFEGLRSATAISHNILAIMKELTIKMCFLLA